MTINTTTGEVRFSSLYDKRKKHSQDLSNKFEDVYQEIPPYAVDLKTGDLLNKTPLPVLVKVGKKDIQKTISSFADDVDLYKILERVAVSGDESLLNRKIGNFADYIDLPDNLNDFNEFVTKAFNDNVNVDKDILALAIQESITSDEVSNLIKKKVEAAVLAQQTQTQTQTQNLDNKEVK